MALNATVVKVDLNIADMDRLYFADHSLTLAQHPSETERRLLVRILAFAFEAGERMSFGKGISTADEPDLWQKDLSNDIEHWIDLGMPSLDRIKKAAGRSQQLSVYAYGDRQAGIWFDQLKGDLARFKHLQVYHFGNVELDELQPALAKQNQFQVSIQDNEALVSSDKLSVTVTRNILFPSP